MKSPKKKPNPAKKVEPLKQPASKEYKLLAVDTEKMPVELSQAERDRCAIELAELNEEAESLNDEKREAMRGWRVKLNAKHEEIADCAAGVLRGARPKAFSVETRAIYKTRMIEKVRAEDGRVISKRPMTPEEEVEHLQTAMGDERATKTLDREPALDSGRGDVAGRLRDAQLSPTLVYSTGPDEPTEEQEEPEIDDDTRTALGGLPRGWRKVWLEASWRIENEPIPLRGGDLWEVYIAIKPTGSTTADLHTSCERVGLSLGHVQRALQIMRRCKLVRADEGGVWFVAEEAPEVETEAGRNDPLPKAERPSRPKRRGAKDTGEAAINAGLGQSEAMEAVH